MTQPTMTPVLELLPPKCEAGEVVAVGEKELVTAGATVGCGEVLVVG